MAPHSKSKRQTLKHKYKVEKKVREHHRQVRKEARKNKRNNALSKKRLRKDPGIPNTFPYKQQLLEDLARKRAESEEKRKAVLKARRDAAKAASANGAASSLAELGRDAAARSANFDADDWVDADNTAEKRLNSDADTSRRAFMREFRRVVDSADVLLEVLDARDPLGCRCFDAERAVVAAGGGTKRLVLVLNKVDLVPRAVVDRWLAYLRNEFPTVAFRASTQGAGTLGQARVSALAATSVGTSECMGAGNLLQLLKNYARSRNLKTSITVGVIGFPNVGKSSLINSLKRARAVSVGATPGVTRTAQEVRLDSNISLLDCPGIVFADTDAEDALVLRNCIRIEQLTDPVTPVETIIRRVGSEPLMVAYSLPAFNTTAELLALICKTRGKYKRGGAFNIRAAACIILSDWNSGKIPFYTLPPAGPQSAQLSAAVVNEWGQEFDIDRVAQAEVQELSKIQHNASTRALFVKAKPHIREGGGDQVMGTSKDIEKDDGAQQTYHVAKKDPAAEEEKKKQRGGHSTQQVNGMEM